MGRLPILNVGPCAWAALLGKCGPGGGGTCHRCDGECLQRTPSSHAGMGQCNCYLPAVYLRWLAPLAICMKHFIAGQLLLHVLLRVTGQAGVIRGSPRVPASFGVLALPEQQPSVAEATTL